MNEFEKKLLGNVFDSLDRLFDLKCEAIDLYMLLYASIRALPNGDSKAVLKEYVEPLEAIVRSGESSEQQRERALQITNTLRDSLNELLPL